VRSSFSPNPSSAEFYRPSSRSSSPPSTSHLIPSLPSSLYEIQNVDISLAPPPTRRSKSTRGSLTRTSPLPTRLRAPYPLTQSLISSGQLSNTVSTGKRTPLAPSISTKHPLRPKIRPRRMLRPPRAHRARQHACDILRAQ
jgi:hypothetical protein